MTPCLSQCNPLNLSTIKLLTIIRKKPLTDKLKIIDSEVELRRVLFTGFAATTLLRAFALVVLANLNLT